MKQKTTGVLLILTLASGLLAPNCATITRTAEQRIPVTSAPAGATVIVNGVMQGVTPLTITLARESKGHVIRIESPGYNPIEIRPKRSLSGAAIFSNFLLGVISGVVPATIIGIGIKVQTAGEWVLMWAVCAAAIGGGFTAMDTGNGNGYSLRPTDLTVTLTKADETPRVDTILVGAEDMRNIKWIRVRRD